MMKHQADIHPRSHWTWLSQWIIDFSVEVGKFHDSEASLTEESLQTFKDSPPYRVHDYIDDGWKTFNDFFARKLKAGMRHWDQDTATDIVITQPADSMFGGVFPVDDTNHVELKGIPWNICQLLDDTLHGEQFAGGQFTHSFLNTFDYHRQHAPVSGTIVDARVIPGLCYLEVVADPPTPGSKRPTSLRMRRKLAHHPNHQAAHIRNASGDKDGMEAPDTPGYQFLQARGVIVIDNPDIGLVAVLPVGMAQVSSVRLSVEVGQQVQKGDEISYFQMGGSDCIIVFQGGVEINFTAKAPDPEPTKYLVGNQIATAKKGQRNAGIGPRRFVLLYSCPCCISFFELQREVGYHHQSLYFLFTCQINLKRTRTMGIIIPIRDHFRVVTME